MELLKSSLYNKVMIYVYSNPPEPNIIMIFNLRIANHYNMKYLFKRQDLYFKPSTDSQILHKHLRNHIGLMKPFCVMSAFILSKTITSIISLIERLNFFFNERKNLNISK